MGSRGGDKGKGKGQQSDDHKLLGKFKQWLNQEGKAATSMRGKWHLQPYVSICTECNHKYGNHKKKWCQCGGKLKPLPQPTEIGPIKPLSEIKAMEQPSVAQPLSPPKAVAPQGQSGGKPPGAEGNAVPPAQPSQSDKGQPQYKLRGFSQALSKQVAQMEREALAITQPADPAALSPSSLSSADSEFLEKLKARMLELDSDPIMSKEDIIKYKKVAQEQIQNLEKKAVQPTRVSNGNEIEKVRSNLNMHFQGVTNYVTKAVVSLDAKIKELNDQKAELIRQKDEHHTQVQAALANVAMLEARLPKPSGPTTAPQMAMVQQTTQHIKNMFNNVLEGHLNAFALQRGVDLSPLNDQAPQFVTLLKELMDAMTTETVTAAAMHAAREGGAPGSSSNGAAPSGPTAAAVAVNLTIAPQQEAGHGEDAVHQPVPREEQAPNALDGGPPEVNIFNATVDEIMATDNVQAIMDGQAIIF